MDHRTIIPSQRNNRFLMPGLVSPSLM